MKIKDILNIIDGILFCGDKNQTIKEFSKDTRTIKNGDTYIGITGENYDGNIFYEEAFKNGASICILSKKFESKINKKFIKGSIILVEDTVEALIALGKYRLSQVKPIVIAVTGSVGKTSTKDMIASVLSKKYKVLKTEGNYNTLVGVPLTILKLIDEEVIILEIGMDKFGEISTLSKMCKPDIALITNVLYCHIENLDNKRENILKAKLEILDGLKTDGLLIINNDDEMLSKAQINFQNLLKVGSEKNNDLYLKNINFINEESIFTTVFKNEEYSFKLKISTKAYLLNSLFSILIGFKLGLNYDEIKENLYNFELTEGRLEKIKTDKFLIINDSYNANKESMINAVEYLMNINNNNRKVLILGDMFELGSYSAFLHGEVGKFVNEKKPNMVVCIGENSKHIYNELNNIKVKYFFNNKNEFYDNSNIFKLNDNILVKASNGMKFIDIVRFLKDIRHI